MKAESRGKMVSLTVNDGTIEKPNWVELKCISDKDDLADRIAGKNNSFYKTQSDADARLGMIGEPVEVSGTYAHVGPRELEVEMQLKPGKGSALKGVEINTGIGKDRWEGVKVYPYQEDFPKLTANGEALVMIPGVKPQACFYVDFRQRLCIEQRCKKMEEEKENDN